MSYSEQRTNLKKAYDLLEAIIDKEERLEEAVHKLKCWHKNTPDTIRLMYDQAYLDFEVKKYQRYLAIAKRNYAILTSMICSRPVEFKGYLHELFYGIPKDFQVEKNGNDFNVTSLSP